MKYLLELSYLNEECFLSELVDEKKFKFNLKEAQAELQAILGPEFYEEISSQYDASANTFSADNLTLYEDYIKDYLAWQTYLEYLGFSQADSTATGFREHNDDNSTIVDFTKLMSLEKNVRRKAQNRKNGIVNFLKLSQSNDSTKYPKWTDCVKNEFVFGISSISKSGSGPIISVNKAITQSE